MATATLSILVEAKNNATKALASVNKALDDMQPAFEGMQKYGTIAFGAITAFAGKAIKDYAEAEKTSAQLEHAVIDVTHATRAQLQATSDLADALEKKGVLDGDNIKMGLAQLSTFGLSNKAVQALGGSLADLAVNQYGVSASGEQLSDTANTIAKALNGQFGVLEKSGIRFTEAQQHAIKFGTEMQKVKAINEGFAQNLKYTNAVALGTVEGQMAKAAVAAGNLSEALGKVLTPIVTQLASTVVPYLTKLQTWIEANPELTKQIVTAAAAIAALTVVVGTLGIVIGVLMAPMTLIVAAIMAVIVAGVLLYQHWDQVKAKAMDVWERIATYFLDIRDRIVAIFEDIIGKIANWIGRVQATISAGFEAVRLFFETIWNGIVTIFTYEIDLIVGLLDTFLSKFDANWKTHLSQILDFFKDTWESTKTVFAAFTAWAGTKLEELARFFATAWSKIKTTVQAFTDWITPKITEMFTELQAKITEWSGPIEGAFTAIWDAVKNVAEGAWESIKNTVQHAFDWISEKVTSIIKAINSVAAAGASITNMAVPSASPTHKASGGIVSTPTHILAGEEGPEAIIPLNRLGRSGGGGGVTIQINGGTFMGTNSREVARTLGDMIIKELQMSHRLG